MELDKEIVERIKSVCVDVAENVVKIANTGMVYAPSKELYSDWKKNGEYTGDKVSTNLRLDWELSDEAFLTDEEIPKVMTMTMINDFNDLIINGDRQGAEDSLLKAIDGVRVRGKQPVDFQCISACLYSEHSKRKKRTEYTLYFRPLVVWE